MAVQTLQFRAASEQGGAVSVPVVIPDNVDPAAVPSLVLALEKAMVVLVHARQADVIARADRLADLATSLVEPTTELIEDRLQRKRTMQRVFAAGDWLTSEQLHDLQAEPPKSKSQPASDWKRRGRIFGVSQGGREYFARYQFDTMYEPLPVIRDVLKAFGDVADPWVLAAWFHYPNGWITGPDGSPLAPKDALDRRDDVIRAAQRRGNSYVA